VPVEESLDLHTFSPRDVVSVVENISKRAAENGTGKCA